jgi:hypothetical protein
MDSSILKSLYQVKQEKYMNKKKKNINLVQHLWHQRIASESLGVEVPDVMEKGKWMFESEVSR